MLWCAFALAAIVVMGRLIHLQVIIPDRFLVDEATTFETLEVIPSRDGRILSSDGRVLAYDAVRYDLEMEFRWLEDPPNPRWLNRQAREMATLSGDELTIEDAGLRVIELRDAMWRQLASGAGISVEEFEEIRQRIQDRVERIRQSVLDRRERNESAAHAEPQFTAESTWWERGWLGIVHELTTPPERGGSDDPLVILEELEHHVVLEGVTLELISQIESQPALFPGTRVHSSTTREYPQHSLASHIVGVRTPWKEEDEAEAAEGGADNSAAGDGTPSIGDRVGRFGIEASYDEVLRGRPGLRRIVRDEDGEIMHEEVVREVVHGVDIVLSVDASLQERCEALLAAALTPAIAADSAATEELPEEATTPTGGCIVAIDVRTGQVLAAASAPTYDLNQLVHPDAATWQALNDDPRRPFFSRATRMTAPPGSVFKILTAIAALESGIIEPDTLIHCQGYLDNPDSHRCYLYRRFGGRHGDLDVTDALCRSCNVFFFTAARQMGPEPIVDWARRFGFGEPAGLDVRGEPGGHLPLPPGYAPRPASDESDDERWYPGTTLQVAIGQASLTVSPLQTARMLAAVANGGWLVTPRLVERVEDIEAGPESSMIQLASAIMSGDEARRIDGLSEETLAVIQQGLQEVVASPYGTGHYAKIDDLAIAGKTGTAEVGGGLPDHAWFAGYAPADAPKVAFVVMLEHGGSGGRAAGPLARELVLALREFGHISE